MDTNVSKKQKVLRFLFLVVLLTPLLLFVGCQANCNIIHDGKVYGSYTVSFYVDGVLYDTLTTDRWGYVEKWPSRPQEDKKRFSGWCWYPDCATNISLDHFRTYENTNLYGKLIEYVHINCIKTYLEDDYSEYEIYEYSDFIDKGDKILEELESSNVYNPNMVNYDYHGLFLNQSYDWCCDVKEKEFTDDYSNTVIKTIYDDCQPFALAAEEFGDINNLTAHETEQPYDFIKNNLASLGDTFSNFINNNLPEDPSITAVKVPNNYTYTTLYDAAINIYSNSLSPVSRTEESERDNTKGLIVGLNYDVSFVNTDNPLDLNYYRRRIAALLGFDCYNDENDEKLNTFLGYANKLSNIYSTHRENLKNNSINTNEALNNGCFYSENGTFIFPMAIKNEHTPVVLTYVIIDPNDHVYFWVHNYEILYKAINERSIKFGITFNNKIYCKNILFVNGPTYSNEITNTTVLTDELINQGNYNDETNTLTLYFKHSVSKYSITYDLGIYANRCDNSENPTYYTSYDSSKQLKAPKTDGSILFCGWKDKETGKIGTSPSSFIFQYSSLQLQAVWGHYRESTDKKSVEYGYYPQTLKASDVTILDETKPETDGIFKGYYKGSDGCYYAKLTATLHNNEESVTVNGKTMINGETYYFKVEPILWDYISNPGTKYQDDDPDTNGIVTQKILDYSTFTDTFVSDESLYFQMLTKKWCSDFSVRTYEGYNDTEVQVSYDECNPFVNMFDEHGQIIKTFTHKHEHIDHNAQTKFNTISQKLQAYLSDKTNANYYHLHNQLNNVFIDYCELPFELYSSDDRYSLFIDFKNEQYKFDTTITTFDVALNTMANLFGLDNMTVLKNRAQALAEKCGHTEYYALENSFVRAYDNTFIFPFLINNNESSIVLAYLIVDSNQNPYLWVNNLEYALRAVNYSNNYKTSGNVNNKLYCKSMLFVESHTPGFTANQLDYYIEGSILSPAKSQISSLSKFGKAKIATDYAIAKGIKVYTSEGVADWWLSSKPDGNSSYVEYVDNSDYYNQGQINYMLPENYCGVVPFLMFNKTPND